MDRLGVGRAIVVGSSYGGAVASNLTLDNPEPVEKLVLVDSVINHDLKNHPIIRLASIPGVGEAITPFLSIPRHSSFRMNGTFSKPNHHMVTTERITPSAPAICGRCHHGAATSQTGTQIARTGRRSHQSSNPNHLGRRHAVIPIKTATNSTRRSSILVSSS